MTVAARFDRPSTGDLLGKFAGSQNGRRRLHPIQHQLAIDSDGIVVCGSRIDVDRHLRAGLVPSAIESGKRVELLPGRNHGSAPGNRATTFVADLHVDFVLVIAVAGSPGRLDVDDRRAVRIQPRRRIRDDLLRLREMGVIVIRVLAPSSCMSEFMSLGCECSCSPNPFP